MKYEFKAIGTHWWIEIYDEIDFQEEIKNSIRDLFDDFEKDYSRFIPSSYISELNREKVVTDFPFEMYSMFLYSDEISKITDYHFNVTAGTILDNLGYDENYSFVKKGEVNLESLRNGVLELTPERISIKEDVKVDLGGIGKGWMIDKLKLFLLDKGIKHFYINGGGDIYATSLFGKEIEFFLESPFDTDSVIGSIKIKDCAIACSSPSKRRWKDRTTGEIHHHLVSSKTLKPENRVSAVYTQATTALQADSAGTALFISPVDKTVEIADKIEVEFLIVFEDSSYAVSEGYKGTLFT